MFGDIVAYGLEVFEELLGIINHSLVLEDGAVVGKVDSFRLSLQLCVYLLGVAVALAEGLESGDGLCTLQKGQSKCKQRV